MARVRSTPCSTCRSAISTLVGRTIPIKFEMRPRRSTMRQTKGFRMAGRRGAAREQAILAAAYEVLGEKGFDRMTIDAVAARAHASKATIYARWPDKRALVSAALEARSHHQPALSLDAGDLRADLSQLVGLFVHLAEHESLRAFVSVLLAAIKEPSLLNGLDDAALARRRQDCQVVVERHAPPNSALTGSLLFELVLGKILTRYLLDRSGLTEAAQAEFIDHVLIPLFHPAPTF